MWMISHSLQAIHVALQQMAHFGRLRSFGWTVADLQMLPAVKTAIFQWV